jgi:hypothetical protein
VFARSIIAVGLALLASGCATLTRDGEQRVDIMVRTMDGRALPSKCRVENSSSVTVGNSPLMQVPVDRSASDLVIECTPFNGSPVARATAVSRSSTMLAVVIQPVAATLVDTMSGRMFDYPRKIVLVSGKARTFDMSSASIDPIDEKPIGLNNVADVSTPINWR